MRRTRCLPSFVLLAATVLAGWQAARPALGDKRFHAGSHGTAVYFGKAWEAYNKAAQEKKLLFLVHISGMFEDPTFT
jgi:hypothetical protein